MAVVAHCIHRLGNDRFSISQWLAAQRVDIQYKDNNVPVPQATSSAQYQKVHNTSKLHFKNSNECTDINKKLRSVAESHGSLYLCDKTYQIMPSLFPGMAQDSLYPKHSLNELVCIPCQVHDSLNWWKDPQNISAGVLFILPRPIITISLSWRSTKECTPFEANGPCKKFFYTSVFWNCEQ